MCMKSQFRLIVFFHFGDGFIDSVQANKGHWSDAGPMLVHRLRRWPNIKPASCQRIVLTGVNQTPNWLYRSHNSSYLNHSARTPWLRVRAADDFRRIIASSVSLFNLALNTLPFSGLTESINDSIEFEILQRKTFTSQNSSSQLGEMDTYRTQIIPFNAKIKVSSRFRNSNSLFQQFQLGV